MIKQICCILIAITLAGGQSSAHPVGQPAFNFTCVLGSKAVRITTEGEDLVYRYGPAGAPELTIRGSAKNDNIFFRHDMGPRSEAQQLRFANGAYAYVLSSLFVAPGYNGKGAADWVKFSVLHAGDVIKTQVCRRAASFEDYDQLDRLPHDNTEFIGDH